MTDDEIINKAKAFLDEEKLQPAQLNWNVRVPLDSKLSSKWCAHISPPYRTLSYAEVDFRQPDRLVVRRYEANGMQQ
jgi:hypothetical protein